MISKNTLQESLDLSRRMGDIKPNFLSELYGPTSNTLPSVRIDEIGMNRLMSKHSEEAGYVIVSASRGENTKEENNRLTRELRSIISNKGYSFIPVYGGFQETVLDDNGQPVNGPDGKPEKRQVYEKSFIILNYDRNGNEMDFGKLREMAIDLCNQYGQDSVLIKAPGEAPVYVDKAGNPDPDMKFSNEVAINDMAQEYFTSLVRTAHPDQDQTGRRGSRFSYQFEGLYVNPKPATYNEGHKRWALGEVILH